MCVLDPDLWNGVEVIQLHKITIHLLHFDGVSVNGISALNSDSVADLVTEKPVGEGNASMKAMIAAKMSVNKDSLRKSERIKLTIHNSTGKLRISCGRVTLLEVPLLFAELSSGYDSTSGASVIVLSDPLAEGALRTMIASKGEAPLNTWVLMVRGSVTDGRAAVEEVTSLMGRQGAIAKGLDQVYSIDRRPSVSGVFRAELRSESSSSPHGSKSVKFARTNDGMHALLRREVSMLVAAQGHPNIISFYGVYLCEGMPSAGSGEDDNEGESVDPCWAIVTEGMDQDLFEKVMEMPLNEHQAREISYGLLNGLQHLHAAGIVHRDVKPENVILKPCGRPVLGSMSIAAFCSEEAELRKRRGSPGYVPPEVLLGVEGHYGTKMDCFSFGVLLYFTLSQRNAFQGSTSSSTFKRTVKCRVDFSKEVFKEVSAACINFIKGFLQRRPSDRPCATTALRGTWIGGMASNGLSDMRQPQVAEFDSGVRARRLSQQRGERQRRRSWQDAVSANNNDEHVRRLMSRSGHASAGIDDNAEEDVSGSDIDVDETPGKAADAGDIMVLFEQGEDDSISSSPKRRASAPAEPRQRQATPSTSASAASASADRPQPGKAVPSEPARNGKVPLEAQALKATLKDLEERKLQAVEDEEFLVAAQIKEEIKELTARLRALEAE